MIVYGSRMYFKTNVVQAFGTCEHCGNYGKNVSYQARKFGHLYFIPLIPMGPKSQVIRECKTCSMGAHVPLEQFDASVDAIAEQFKSWISAIGEGETELVVADGEEPVNIGVLISGILEDLYCLKEIESIDSIHSIFEAHQLKFEKEIVSGQWAEIKGDLNQAQQHYHAAARHRPDEAVSLYRIGVIELKRRDTTAAEEAFLAYLKKYPDDAYPIHVELATAYEMEKNFPKLVESYDVLYEINPELLQNKGMKKLYKKACKKSGVQGKFLDQM